MASGHTSARGLASSKERRAAELLDTVVQRGDDGERDYSDGAAAVASAMVRESEGEELGGRSGCLWGRGEGEGSFPVNSWTRGAARRRAAAWHACCARRRAAACLPGQAKQLAGAVAGLGRQVGLLGAR